ncbi:hypothetical protein K474DRAFT_1670821, partial [Panus rudis PR-1116 ss-1]
RRAQAVNEMATAETAAQVAAANAAQAEAEAAARTEAETIARLRVEAEAHAAMMAEMHAQVQAAQAQAAAAHAAAVPGPQENMPVVSEEHSMFPRPPRKEIMMRYIRRVLGNAQYHEIQEDIHVYVKMAKVNMLLDFRCQEPEKLACIYRAAIEDYPVLQCFQQDWASEALVKQFIRNRRRKLYDDGILEMPESRKRKKGPRQTREPRVPRRTSRAARLRGNLENIPPPSSQASGSAAPV